MTAGAWVLLVAVAAALGFGLYRLVTDGRFRGTHAVRGVAVRATESRSEPADVVEPLSVVELVGTVTDVHLELGERATLLQFSSAFCAPCRATRRVLSDVAELVPGVVHHEVDAEHHLELVRRLDVVRTPTTLVLDARGVEVSRAAGAPTKTQVLTQVGALL